jgi:programmed cell death 6-interacting protein
MNTQDKMKDNSIARLAAQCSEFYAEAARLMNAEKVKYLWDREWLPTVNGKQEAYRALSEFYQAAVCDAVKKIGERIARLQVS